MTAAQRRQLLDQIRSAVRECDLEPAEIARQSGVNKAALSRFLSGARGLSVESIEKIAPVLGLRIVLEKE